MRAPEETQVSAFGKGGPGGLDGVKGVELAWKGHDPRVDSSVGFLVFFLGYREVRVRDGLGYAFFIQSVQAAALGPRR